MPRSQSVQALRKLFSDKTVVDLVSIQNVLGGVSSMTAFRYLREVDYRRSYNCNGRFYTLFEASGFDRWGLWSWGDVHFSVEGSLRETVRRMVAEAEVGATHRELQDRLHVRVQNTLADLMRKGEVDREGVEEVFVYVHVEAGVREGQLRRRREWIEAAAQAQAEMCDETVIQVLLQLIRHPGSRSADVARRLRRRSPPISSAEVQAVFSRYRLGQKGGRSRS